MSQRRVNNEIYSSLGARWYTAEDDPVALLRAESRLRTPWMLDEITKKYGDRKVRILDVGCGGGFLVNALAKAGHDVTGVDASPEALAVATAYDETKSAKYREGDATRLDLPDASFDVVSAMDLLEHVEDPRLVVHELTRVLRPGGLCFFHTFNRTLRAWLIVIKGVEWFVRNVPADMHVLRLFVKPADLSAWLSDEGLDVQTILGSRPVVDRAFLRMLATGRVAPTFRFRFVRSLAMGYTGVAMKRATS